MCAWTRLGSRKDTPRQGTKDFHLTNLRHPSDVSWPPCRKVLRYNVLRHVRW